MNNNSNQERHTTASTSHRKLSNDSTGSAWLEEDEFMNSMQHSFQQSPEFNAVFDELDQKHRAHEEKHKASISSSSSSSPQLVSASRKVKAAATSTSPSLGKWQKLQDLLKQEQVLLDIERETCNENVRKIDSAEQAYWKSVIDLANKRSSIGSSSMQSNSAQRILFDSSRVFGISGVQEGERKVSEFLRELRWSPDVLEQVIEQNKTSISSQVRNLSAMFVNGFFATHGFDVDLSSDIVAFINRNIRMEIALSQDSKNMLRTDTLPKKIIKDFLNQPKFTHPITQLFKPIIADIAKYTEYLHLEPDLLDLEVEKRSKHRKTNASLSNRTQKPNPIKRSMSVLISGKEADEKQYTNESHIDKYARIFKSYDTTKQHRASTISDTLLGFFKSSTSSSSSNSSSSSSQQDKLQQQSNQSSSSMPITNSSVPSSMRFTIASELTSKVRNPSEVILARRSEMFGMNATNNGISALGDLSKLSASTMLTNSVNDPNFQIESRENERQLLRKEKRLSRLLTSVLDVILQNLEVIPRSVRIVCALVRHHAMQKYPDLSRAHLDFTLSFFIIDDWALSIFMKSYKPADEHDLHQQDLISKNMLYIQSILKNVMKKQFFGDGIEQRLNPLIEALEPRVTSFFTKLLDLDLTMMQEYILSPKPHNLQSTNSRYAIDNRSEFSSVLLNLENIQKLSELVARCSNARPQVVGLAQAVVDLGTRVFSNRNSDLNLNRNDMIYVAIPVHRNSLQQVFDSYYETSETELSSQHNIYESFRLDYQDLTPHFQRFKALLRTLLVHVDRISTIASFSGFTHLNLPFSTLISMLSHPTYNKFNSKGVNVPLIARRLLVMTRDFLEERYTASDMRAIRVFMRKEHARRMSTTLNSLAFKEKTKQSKLLTLIAESTAIVEEDQRRLVKANLKNRVKNFMLQFNLNVCISSPATRRNLSSATKAQYSDYNHDILWVEDLSACIHKQTNLDFVKELTGEVNSGKPVNNDQVHCDTIMQFIEEFSLIPELEDMLLQGEDVCEFNSAYTIVMDRIEDGLKEFPDFSGCSNEEINAIQSMVSRRINKFFHARVFPKRATYPDLAFATLARSLEFISPLNLEIEPHTHAEWIWKIAASALNSMETKNTPEKKIGCILECMNLIADVLSLSSAKSQEASADLMIPHFIYVLLKSKPRRISSNMNFITAFQLKKNMNGQNGYFFIQSLSAIKFIEGISPQGLKLITDLTFQTKLMEEQRRIGFSFIKKRKRDGLRVNLQEIVIKQQGIQRN